MIDYNALFLEVLALIKGKIRPQCNTPQKEFAFDALSLSIVKYYGAERVTPEMESLCIETFLAVNDSMAKVEVVKQSSCFTDEFVNEVVGEARMLLLKALQAADIEFFPYWEVIQRSRCGPGVSLGIENESSYTKLFDSRFTTTNKRLWDFYVQGASGDQTFLDALFENVRVNGPPVIVSGSRVSFAPKTAEKARMIAVEPSMNMLWQLGTHEVITRKLLPRLGINLPRQQEVNRELARIGSISNLLATLDLSSASDSISLQLIGYLFPKSWVSWFMTMRSPSMSIHGIEVPLHMLSTMGNGFTFSVLTTCLAALTQAVYRVLSIKIDNDDNGVPNWAVYGDDIIVTTDVVQPLTWVLESLGFSLNRSKTFSDGPFRESCGADWLGGYPVTGVKCKKLDSPSDVYSICNRLRWWSDIHGVDIDVPLWRILSSLDDVLIVPFWDDVESGFMAEVRFLPDRCRRRLSSDHRSSQYGGFMYRRLTPKKVQVNFTDEAGTLLSDLCIDGVRRKLNVAGALKLMSQGALRGRGISLRSHAPERKIEWSYAPGWGCRTAEWPLLFKTTFG